MVALRRARVAQLEELRVAEVRSEPGVASTTQTHPDHLGSIWVLAGERAPTVGDRALGAPAGSWLQLAPGTPRARRYWRARCDIRTRRATTVLRAAAPARTVRYPHSARHDRAAGGGTGAHGARSDRRAGCDR